MHHQGRGLRAATGQRHHRHRPVRHDQLRWNPVHDAALFVAAQCRRQLQNPRRQSQHLALDHHPERHPTGGGLLLRLVLEAADRDRVPGDQGAHLTGRAQLQLVETMGHGARPGDHLDQIVHGGLGGVDPVLLGQQHGRQLRLFQLVALLGQQRPQRDPGRRRHPAPRTGRRLRGQPVLLQPPQRPLGVPFGQRQPVREIGDLRGSHRHQRAIGGLLRLVETYGSQHSRTSPEPPGFPVTSCRPAGRPWRKAATA